MSNQQFKVLYNGQEVAVTCVGDRSYYVQISYKPLKLEHKLNENGEHEWVDLDSNVETNLSKHIGSLIHEQRGVENDNVHH
ncbi:MAG: hypothetical protein EOO43_26005 [Flavobacterium sp.]|nr:MAG: hypothetical protein EOO43_26005 [Flavobacterium sp.]